VGRVLSRAQSTAQSLNAENFGFSTSNSGTANATALNNAIAAAQAAGIELRLPAGTFKINMHNVAPNSGDWAPGAIRITASVVIRGADMERTILVSDGWVEPTYNDPQPSSRRTTTTRR